MLKPEAVRGGYLDRGGGLDAEQITRLARPHPPAAPELLHQGHRGRSAPASPYWPTTERSARPPKPPPATRSRCAWTCAQRLRASADDVADPRLRGPEGRLTRHRAAVDAAAQPDLLRARDGLRVALPAEGDRRRPRRDRGAHPRRLARQRGVTLDVAPRRRARLGDVVGVGVGHVQQRRERDHVRAHRRGRQEVQAADADDEHRARALEVLDVARHHLLDHVRGGERERRAGPEHPHERPHRLQSACRTR